MKCPECGKSLKKNHKSCVCGWGDKIVGYAPTLNELKLEMEHRLEKTDLDYSPEFFLKLFDPHKPEDSPMVTSNKNGDRFWTWQYRTHTLYLLGKFIKQKKVFQDFVIEARKKGIHWRGDDPAFFYMLVTENEKMQQVGIDQYRKEARQKLRKFR